MKKLLTLSVMMLLVLGLLTACTLNDNQNVYYNSGRILNTTRELEYTEFNESITEGQAYLTFQELSGIDTLFIFTAEEFASITVFQCIDGGQAKVVLIDPYDRIIELKETTVINMTEGYYKIKVVGNDACGMIAISILSHSTVQFIPVV